MAISLNETIQTPPVPDPADAEALATPFLQALVRLVRAQDTFGAYAKRTDAHMLAGYVTKEQRRAAAALCRADPDLVWRIEQFYGAIGLVVEQETGLVASPMAKIYDEGFGNHRSARRRGNEAGGSRDRDDRSISGSGARLSGVA